MASHQKNIKLNQSDNKHQKVAEKNDEKLVDDDDLDNVPHPLCIVIATKLQKRDIRELLSDDQRIALNVTEVSLYTQIQLNAQHTNLYFVVSIFLA